GIGNGHKMSGSLLAPGTTISATIANEFTEAVGDLYTSSLVALGLILFIITFIILAIARYMLMRIDARAGACPMSTSVALHNSRKRKNGVMMTLCVVAAGIGLAWL